MTKAYKNWTYSDSQHGTHVYVHDNYSPDANDLDLDRMKWSFNLEEAQEQVEDQEAEWAELFNN